MFGIKRRRTLIRVLSYTVSAFCIAIIFAVSGFVMAYKFRMNTEYSYQRALSELSEHVDNIDLALQKGYYASTSAQLVGLSAQIWSDAGAAKTDISEMPLASVQLDNTTKFLSQVGDYANSLSRQLANNQKISDQDRATIKGLSGYAKQLSTHLSDLVSDMQSGRLRLFKSEKLLNSSNIRQAAVQTSLEDGFKSIEKTFSGLPSMIYDGPFSDNVTKKTPLLTQNKPDVGKDQAKKNAAAFLGTDVSKLSDSGETAGNLPTYNFTSGTVNISVTKAGGYVVRMLNSRAPNKSTIDNNGAIAKASDFLNSHGIKSMTTTYSLSNNNVCTVNFAYSKSGVTCYPDLMKLGVAQDTGEIMTFDATGYIMNHTRRTLPSLKVSEKSTRAMLNPSLKVEKQSVVLIPTGGGDEMLCYEYICTGENNQKIIDYFNTQNGVEQQLLVLLSTPGGTLAM